MSDNRFMKDTWEVLDAQLSSTQGDERGMREAGYYLQSLRKRRGLSRTSVAEKVGISEACLTAIENGLMPTDKISDELLSRLAILFKINTNELLILLERPIKPVKSGAWNIFFYAAMTDLSVFKVADILLVVLLFALFWRGNWELWLTDFGVWLTLVGGSLFLLFEKLAGNYWQKAGKYGDKVLALPDGPYRQQILRLRYAVERRFRLMSILMGIAITLAILPVYAPWFRGGIDNQQMIIQPTLIGIFLAWGYRTLAKSYHKEIHRWQSKLLHLEKSEEQNITRRNISASRKLTHRNTLFIFISEVLAITGTIVLLGGHTFQLMPILFQLFTLGTLYLLLSLAPRFISGNYLVPMDLLHLAPDI